MAKNTYSENAFLNGLRAAMESNGTPTIDEVESGLLIPQTTSNDPSGNPDEPGDPQQSPVAPKEGETPKPTEDPLTKDVNDPSGNPGAPGDATADPAQESLGSVFQKFLNPHKDIKAQPALSVAKAFIQSIDNGTSAYANRIESYESMKTDIESAKAAYDKYMADAGSSDDGLTTIVVTEGRYSALVTILNPDKKDVDSLLAKDLQDIQFPRGGLNRKTFLVSASAVFSDLAKSVKKTNTDSMDPASEAFDVHDFLNNVNLYEGDGKEKTIPEQKADDPSGNAGDPAANAQTPVSPSGDTKPSIVEEFIRAANDPSGNAGSPTGANGTPVSKSSDTKVLPKEDYEKAADDKSGNPGSPGVDAESDKSFESFIDLCEQSMVRPDRGRIYIPESMSLEAYALELGMGEIISKALEADLTAAERRALDDSDFAFPEERKWPLHDEAHVKSAIENFHWCPKERQRELAKAILRAIRKFGMKEIHVSEANPFLKYYPDAIVTPRKKPQSSGGAKPAGSC